MLRRRFLAALALGGLAPAALAQRGETRLGILASGTRVVETRIWAEMLRHLAALGHREGANLAIEWRFADNAAARLPELARELVAARVQVAATIGTPATRALQRATTTIPIVTGAVPDPVLGGFAKTVARPGGNITGLSLGASEIASLQVSLLRSAVPKLSRLTIVRGPGDWNDEVAGPMSETAKRAGIAASPAVVRDASSLEGAFREARSGGGTAAAFVYEAAQVDPAELAEIALRHRVPTMFADKTWVIAGGLMSYNMYHEDRMRRVAHLVSIALRGSNVAETPFEIPTNSQFVVNRRTAEALGLVLPQQLLMRADETVD